MGHMFGPPWAGELVVAGFATQAAVLAWAWWHVSRGRRDNDQDQTPQPTLRLWLHVVPPGATKLSAGRTWYRDITTPFLPRAGDEVSIRRHHDDPDWDGEWSANLPVYQVWWTGDGQVQAALADIYVDPTGQGLGHRALVSSPRRATTWWTDRDGPDPNHWLPACGWTQYHHPAP